MADDLFTPSITPATYRERRPPWRPGSLLYPAVFGGATAVTVLALVNAGRLRLPGRAVLAILGAGLAALVARAVVTVTLLDGQPGGPARLIGALAGALVWLPVNLLQKGPFRAYELRRGQPASLWGPGVAAVLVFGIAEALVILLVAGA